MRSGATQRTPTAPSSIDASSEALIQQALGRLEPCTSIIVAHRLSTIQHCEKIFVLARGKIRESGRHQDLLAARGLYYRLYTLQARRQPAGANGSGLQSEGKLIRQIGE